MYNINETDVIDMSYDAVARLFTLNKSFEFEFWI